MNKIIQIGYIGTYRCYLNVSMEEAKRRYSAENLILVEDFDNNGIRIDTFVFDDEFEAYDVWAK